MSKAEKLIKRFLSKRRDFTYSELETLSKGFGYKEVKRGKASGSRVAFINDESKHIIRLHKPHPKPELKRYQLEYLIEELKNKGLVR